MFRKEINNFTGFIATYEDGSSVTEKENFFSKKRGKNCKTNWLDVDQSRLFKLELYWKGIPSASIDKNSYPEITEGDWYFTHTGYMDLHNREIKVLKRNIGFKADGLLTIFSVSESDGVLKVDTRAA
jgi:hypothetical protein